MTLQKRVFALLCALCCLALCACTAPYSADSRPDVTLPPYESPYTAPVGDAASGEVQEVALYLPQAGGSTLIPVRERMLLPSGQHPALTVLQRLLSYAGNTQADMLSPDIPLRLSDTDPLVLCGTCAVVNLSADALELSPEARSVVCQALANTLCQWEDIHQVCVLFDQIQPGLDAQRTIPAGCYTRDTVSSLEALYAAPASRTSGMTGRRFSLPCALYLPTGYGRGILCEAREVSFASAEKVSMAASLLSALAEESSLATALSVPDPTAFLSSTPQTETGSRGRTVLVLRFTEELNEALIRGGIPRSVMMAALCCTLTANIPDLEGVRVYVGAELINTLAPGQLYQNPGEALRFEDGVLRRAAFSDFYLDEVTLCLKRGEDALVAVRRAVPAGQTRSVRFLLQCLADGPARDDSAECEAVLPPQLSASDVVGVSAADGTLLLNLSEGARETLAALPEAEARLAVYAMVNTLTLLPGIHSVAFFFDGRPVEQLSGALYMASPFWANPSLMEN